LSVVGASYSDIHHQRKLIAFFLERITALNLVKVALAHVRINTLSCFYFLVSTLAADFLFWGITR
jgi:hypothetical protein